MKKVALKILSSSKIYAKTKIEDLDEKRLVPSMMLRRRLTRNSKVMLYLSDKCGFNGTKIVYGTCYSELQEAAKMANAVITNGLLSPTSFQNSVYNTAPSYYSLIHKDRDEIITVSSGMKTSLDTLKTAALQALVSKEKILCVAVECINIENIEEVNRCTDYLEAGVAIVVEISDDMTDAKEIEDHKIDGIIDSLQDLMSVVGIHDDGIDKILVEL
ncbi:MAG: beta-ketoacyl synthase chain length factor [Sulfurimonas sp.]|nr:beta-ketoacyl synthase chain length factor [Sulfurimonas sp.]